MTTIERVREHHEEALGIVREQNVVGTFLQGSQNYKLDLPTSDVDTKCIIVPTFEWICLNRKPMSTTHIRKNDEHIDFKDVRLYMETFRKQNLNFLEILFTDYYILNPDYAEQWMRLVKERERIARMNPFRAVKSMKGVALEKYHAMEHRYPAKADIIDKYGYDGKQISHLIRVFDFLDRYIKGEEYESCLIPRDYLKEKIMDFKMLDRYSLEEARIEAGYYKMAIEAMADVFCAEHEDHEDPAMKELLEDVSFNTMKIATLKELIH